jgi:hypothetical protein
MAKSKELDPTMRARICELHSIKWGYKRIHSKYPNISISTIRYTIKMESKRLNQISLPRSGGPHKLSQEQCDHLYDLANQNPHIKIRELLQILAGQGRRRAYTEACIHAPARSEYR